MPSSPTTSPLVNSRATTNPANAIGPAFNYTNLASQATSSSRRCAATFNVALAASEIVVAAFILRLLLRLRLLPRNSRRRPFGSATTLPKGHARGPTASSSTSTWDSWTASRHYVNNSMSTSSRISPPPSRTSLRGTKLLRTTTASATRRRSAIARTALTALTTPRQQPLPASQHVAPTWTPSSADNRRSSTDNHPARLPSQQRHHPGSHWSSTLHQRPT